MGHGGEVWQNVVHWRKEWQTTSVFLPWEPRENMKRQKDMTLKDELPRPVATQYATGKERRNNSRKNEEMEPKQKQHIIVDVTGDGRIAIIVNKRVWNAVLGCNLKNDRMISVHYQGKPFNITVIQVYALTSNAVEAEVEQFFEDLQDLLELIPPQKMPFSL